MERPESTPDARREASSRCGVVLLAAGFSRRMGAPKALLPWGDDCVIDAHLQNWRAAGASSAEFLDLATTARGTLREWLHDRGRVRHFVACEDAAVAEDFDTPSQYARALAERATPTP
jgi:CTP:molybdopterin cytidylyltransferase MocA